MNFIEAIKELRKSKKRKFNQTFDLLINLKNFDIRRESINAFIPIPYKIEGRKICAFLDEKTDIFDFSITKKEFPSYDKKKQKNLVKEYDFFVSLASLMPSVATSFGRVLGPAGKMPSPQLGIIPKQDENILKELIEKIEKTIRVRTKEPSIKIAIGKESMSDEEISENAIAVYKAILDKLPRKRDNIKSVMLKLTMSKPIKIKEEEKSGGKE